MLRELDGALREKARQYDHKVALKFHSFQRLNVSAADLLELIKKLQRSVCDLKM